MRRGCLMTLGFFCGALVTWIGLLVYLMSNDPRSPSDSGGYAMGAGMFLISWGVVIAAIAGAVVAFIVWGHTLPKDE